MTDPTPAQAIVSRPRWKAYPAYRDAGLPWLGRIPSHWNLRKLKHSCKRSALYGLNKPSGSYEAEGVRFIRTTDIDENGTLRPHGGVYLPAGLAEGYTLEEGDLLLSRSGTIGRSLVYSRDAQGPCAYAGYLVRFVPDRSLVPRFASYSTRSQPFFDWLGITVIESTIGNVNGQKYANMEFALPSIAEQRAIADFLDRETARIDALLAKKERLIALLQEKRSALISQAVTRGLDPSVPLKESGVEWLGKVPAHWEVRRLKYVALSMIAGPFGSSLTKDLYTTAGYRVYGQEQVIPANFAIGGYYVSPELFSAMKRYAVSPGDVLVSCVGTFGRVAVVPSDAEPGIINPRLIRLVPAKNVILPEYMGLLLGSSLAFEQMERISRGGTMGVINLGLLAELLLPLPPLPEQSAIASFLADQTARIDALLAKVCESIERWREYRAALIAAAVTGKIDVRELSPLSPGHYLPDAPDE